MLTHLARNADGMINLLLWARTGIVTPAYASAEARVADIEKGAVRSPDRDPRRRHRLLRPAGHRRA